MHGGMCKCPHHVVNKVLMLLAWVAGVLFFWSAWKGAMVWGFDYDYYAWSVVVLVLLSKVSMNCGCCGWGKMGMGGKMMEGGKECAACMGRGGEHMH